MIVKCNKCGTEMELPDAMRKDGLHFSCCQCSSRFSYFNGRIFELKKPDRIPLPGGWKNLIKSRVRKLARQGVGLKMIFLLAFTAMFVIGIGIVVFISHTSTTVGSRYIGRKFAMEGYGITDVSNVPKSKIYSRMTESVKLLEDCNLIIRGRTVPKPFDFHSLKISYSPKSKTIYSVSGVIKKTKGHFVEDETIKNTITQCVKFVNDEMRCNPQEAIIAESCVFCTWENSTASAVIFSGRDADEIRMYIFSPSLCSKAYKECPTSVSDEKVIYDRYDALCRAAGGRMNDNNNTKERLWYLEQLRRNNLMEFMFERIEKNVLHGFSLSFVSLDTELELSKITILEIANGTIISEGIETGYAKKMMDARKKMFAVDGK